MSPGGGTTPSASPQTLLNDPSQWVPGFRGVYTNGQNFLIGGGETRPPGFQGYKPLWDKKRPDPAAVPPIQPPSSVPAGLGSGSGTGTGRVL
jgi:hypothetical protein